MAISEKKRLKDKAWKMFALYIKIRDASPLGECTCCTCGRKMWFFSRECQAGHFVPSRSNSVLFDEQIVHAQCEDCNGFKGGEYARYTIFMQNKYGYSDAQIIELLNRKHKAIKITEQDLLDKIRYYYEMIQVMWFHKFKMDQDMLQRVEDKIKTMGVKKILDKKGME